MKKLSIQNVKKLSKLEMKRITGGSGGQNDCNTTCLKGYTGYCHYVCTFCYIPPGQVYGLCQA